MPQLLEMIFGLLSPDQAEEERTKCENRKARVQAKLSLLSPIFDLRTTKDQGSLTIHLEIKLQGNTSNVSQPATGPQSAKTTPWTMPSLQTNR